MKRQRGRWRHWELGDAARAFFIHRRDLCGRQGRLDASAPRRNLLTFDLVVG
jgi:hypothetical protein